MLARTPALGGSERDHFWHAHRFPFVQEHPAPASATADAAVAGEPRAATLGAGLEVVYRDPIAGHALDLSRNGTAEIALYVSTQQHGVSPAQAARPEGRRISFMSVAASDSASAPAAMQSSQVEKMALCISCMDCMSVTAALEERSSSRSRRSRPTNRTPKSSWWASSSMVSGCRHASAPRSGERPGRCLSPSGPPKRS